MNSPSYYFLIGCIALCLSGAASAGESFDYFANEDVKSFFEKEMSGFTLFPSEVKGGDQTEKAVREMREIRNKLKSGAESSEDYTKQILKYVDSNPVGLLRLAADAGNSGKESEILSRLIAQKFDDPFKNFLLAYSIYVMSDYSSGAEVNALVLKYVKDSKAKGTKYASTARIPDILGRLSKYAKK